MKPVLYEKNETQFRTFGLGEIADAYVVEVTRERNGNYTLYIKYPLDGVYAARFQNGMKIKADAGVRTKWQTFEISRVKRNSKEHIEVFAKHISHRTEYLQLNPKVKAGQQTAGMALSLWRSNLVGGAVFDVWSDIETVADINWEIGTVNNAREALGGVAGSILDRFGGEYEFDNTLIRLHRRLGRQAPIVLEYGRNVVSIEQDDSLEEVYTSIYPYAKYTPQTEGETQAEEVLVTLPELVVDGPYLANFDKRRIKLVDFSGQFQDQEVPTVAKLRSLAQSYVISNRIGLAKMAIEVDYVDLAKTLDYKDFAVMEEVELCDVIPLYYPKFGITSSEEKVVEVVYDVLNDENKTIKLGTLGQSISQQLTSSVVERVEHLEKKQASQDQVLSSYLVDSKGNRIWRERPSTDVEHKVGDVWFEKNGIYERMYIWNGNQWEKILDTEDVDRVGKQVEAIQVKANQVAAQANQAGQKADQALTRAGASQSLAQTAKDTADRAIRQAGDNLRTAQERASQLQTDLDAAKRTITSQAKDILNQAKAQEELTRKVQTVEETANGTMTSVTELTKTVNANTGNLTSVTQRVATAENTLTNVRNQYSTLKTTVDGQSGKVTSLERQTADLSNGLNGVKERFEKLKIGASNLILAKEAEDGFLNTSGNVQRPSAANKEQTSGFISVQPNEELMFQVWATVPDGQALWRAWQFYDANQRPVGSRQVPSGAWAAKSGKQQSQDVIQVPEGAAYIRVTARQYEDGKMQLERGNVPTDYAPAEEDFRQEFADYVRTEAENKAELGKKLETLDGSLADAKTLFQQTADGIKTLATKTEVNGVTGRLSSAESTISQLADQISQRLTSTQVEQAITGKGYQTASQVNTTITGKGYQTKAQVDANITGRGYITTAALAGYVPTTTFDNYKTETADAIERRLTATQALIPKEYSGNLLKNGDQKWRNSRGATYELDDDVEANRDYTLTIRYWNGTGGRAVSTNLFGDWQVGSYDREVDAWVIRGKTAQKLAKGHRFNIHADPGNALGNADWATLTKGSMAMSRYQEPMSNLVTAVDFNKVKETAQLYERVLGKTEGDVTANLARQVMTSELYQTEVTQARDNQVNLLVGTEQTKGLIFDRPNTSNFQVQTLFSLPGNRSFAQNGFKVGDSVTLTFDYEVTDNNFRRIVFNNFRVEGYDTGYKFQIGAVTSVRSGTFQGTFTFATEAQLAAYQFGIRADAPSLNCKLVVKNCRLNRGSVAYPWQAHFEDLSAQATRVSQLADSYAIQTLGSAGQVLSQINLATGGALFQVGENKLVVTPTTTYIQDGTIKSAMIESLDAGKITAGEFDASKARIINLDVNSVNGLDANFIKTKIELALVEWLQGKMITSQNGTTIFDLEKGNLNFNDNNTGVFRKQENASTQGMLFQNVPINVNGTQRVLSRTIIGAERRGNDLATKWQEGGFNGLVVDTILGVLSSDSPHSDRTSLVGDTIRLVHTYDTDVNSGTWRDGATGWEFKTYAPIANFNGTRDPDKVVMKPSGIDLNRSVIYAGDIQIAINATTSYSLKQLLRDLANAWRHYKNAGFSQAAYSAGYNTADEIYRKLGG